jgi:hypothetical protein
MFHSTASYGEAGCNIKACQHISLRGSPTSTYLPRWHAKELETDEALRKWHRRLILESCSNRKTWGGTSNTCHTRMWNVDPDYYRLAMTHFIPRLLLHQPASSYDEKASSERIMGSRTSSGPYSSSSKSWYSLMACVPTHAVSQRNGCTARALRTTNLSSSRSPVLSGVSANNDVLRSAHQISCLSLHQATTGTAVAVVPKPAISGFSPGFRPGLHSRGNHR